ncbi:unnamed protein product [Notodromas monacha]|nr:unnamed protein product [Notodromas monacha]CAG0917071.1 unnamed protein product [Notodromas monacha]
MLPTTDEDGEKIETVLKGFEDYCAKYDVELLEALGPGDVLRDRLAMCHLLAEVSSGMKGVFTPPFALLVRPDVNENRQILKEAGVSFPCVLKPLESKSHHMAMVFHPGDLDKFEYPCVAMSFVNHDAILHKVFIVGNEVEVVLRPSIQNLIAGDLPMERFHSSRVSKPDADHPLIGPCAATRRRRADNAKRLDFNIAAAIGKRCRERTGMRLLGVDVVVDSTTGHYGLIDINKFPGSSTAHDLPIESFTGYEGMENLAQHMAKLLLQVLKERDAGAFILGSSEHHCQMD